MKRMSTPVTCYQQLGVAPAMLTRAGCLTRQDGGELRGDLCPWPALITWPGMCNARENGLAMVKA